MNCTHVHHWTEINSTEYWILVNRNRIGEIGFYHVHILPYSTLLQFARVSWYFWVAVEQLGSNAVDNFSQRGTEKIFKIIFWKAHQVFFVFSNKHWNQGLESVCFSDECCWVMQLNWWETVCVQFESLNIGFWMKRPRILCWLRLRPRLHLGQCLLGLHYH